MSERNVIWLNDYRKDKDAIEQKIEKIKESLVRITALTQQLKGGYDGHSDKLGRMAGK